MTMINKIQATNKAIFSPKYLPPKNNSCFVAIVIEIGIIAIICKAAKKRGSMTNMPATNVETNKNVNGEKPNVTSKQKTTVAQAIKNAAYA